jgi:hypothetical protein
MCSKGKYIPFYYYASPVKPVENKRGVPPKTEKKEVFIPQ